MNARIRVGLEDFVEVTVLDTFRLYGEDFVVHHFLELDKTLSPDLYSCTHLASSHAVFAGGKSTVEAARAEALQRLEHAGEEAAKDSFQRSVDYWGRLRERRAEDQEVGRRVPAKETDARRARQRRN